MGRALTYKTEILISDSEAAPLVEFALTNYSNKSFFEDNGPGRYFCSLVHIETPLTAYVIQLRKEKFKLLGITEFFEEPNFGIFLGVNTDGAHVHEHTDSSILNFYHFRLNFLLQKPIDGGDPIINHTQLFINEGESWINLASEWQHSSTKVIGSNPRIVLSLGALIKKEYLDNIFKLI